MHLIVYGIHIFFFYSCLRLWFPDVETNPVPRRPITTVCRLLCSNVRGLAGNLIDLTVASSKYDILLCSETLVSDSRHVSELLVPRFGRLVLLCRGRMHRAREMAAYLRGLYGAFRQPKFECDCCEMMIFRVCGVRQNLYVFSLYRNSDLEDRIFDCLLTSTATVQAEDVRGSFIFVCDWNAIIRSGWVLQPQIVTVLHPLTSQLCLVVTSWLSARPMHVVEHLTSRCLMFLT